MKIDDFEVITNQQFKKPLNLDEQIEHLQKDKKISFDEVGVESAKDILYTKNYINIISPFKYRFAKKDKKGRVLKDKNGCHIYEQKTDFKNYLDLYNSEREKYPIIYERLMAFETLISSVVSYEVLTNYDLKNTINFDYFLDSLKGNINTSALYSQVTVTNMFETVQTLREDITKYKNPYIVLDNLSFNNLLNILVNLDKPIKQKCIDAVIQRQKLIKANDEKTFYKQVSKLIRIRNCVCHNDSLEILIRYLSRKHKRLRTSSDKYSYARLIEKLSKQESI